MMKRLFCTIFVCWAFALLAFAQTSSDTLVVKGKYHTYLITKSSMYRPEKYAKPVLVFPFDNSKEGRWIKISGSAAPIIREAKKILQPYVKELGEIGVGYQTDFKGNVMDVSYYFPDAKGCQYYLPFIDILDEAAFSIMKNGRGTLVTITPEGEKYISAYQGIAFIPFFIKENED